jgi:hypothetical protein
MTIATFVKKETEAGIMIVHQLLYMVDMEAESQLNLINKEDLEAGNTIEKHNTNP